MDRQMDEIHHPDDIVITGISGAFPQSDNMEEFAKNLSSGKDMITSVVRDNTSLNIGSLKTMNRFDHSFFHVTHQQAESMTIASRMVLEKVFEAILDAGYNPSEIKGKNIAVACGVYDCGIEGDPTVEKGIQDFVAITGRSQFMIANRVSNWLDIHGPSFVVNTACSSSMYALDNAIKWMQTEKTDGAIICSPNFCFTLAALMGNNPVHSAKGNSSPFDASAKGYVRAEAVVAVFLQRRKDARRIYANIIHSTTNCDGFKKEGISHPSVAQQKRLYEQFYKEIDIDPRSISYIEAHGTGTQVGDMAEGTSIEEFFCQGRTTPLKIGTVKSNIGHTEAAAVLCGIAKMIISFENGIIPPNLRYQNPNPNIKGLLNGNLKVLVKPTPLEGKYFALNAFGIGGANGHLLITPHDKIKKHQTSNVKFPYLVTASGRTEEAVDVILNNVEKHHADIEYIALMHKIFAHDIGGHLHRGYIILHKNESSTFTKSKAHFSGEKRPIWFVFSGMGSQWPTMGKALMNIPIFFESIQKSHQVLQNKGVDLIRIITQDDPQIFKNILNSFVGIAAIQIALVDILKSLDIQPDGIIGHSLGESGCAYADGCFTAEQMILAAYYRGLVSLETEFIHGRMASIGMGYEEMRNIIPAEIDIACHNSSTNCTISGPSTIVREFVDELKQKKIFAREVETSNIAYHSRYIASAAPKFIAHLQQIIPEPKLRSEKWISTSALEHEWSTNQAKYSSAEYHINNLLKPVLFEEGCRHIPSNAITIEIAPHGLLNAILKRSLPNTVQNISLTMRNQENGVEFLLNAIGRMYEAGCMPKLDHLYPAVEFPVSRSTPMISSLIKWQHNEPWPIGNLQSDVISTERRVQISFSNHEEFLKDHVIDGRNLYPAFGYLWIVLETLCIIRKKKVHEVSVIFENVRFERATTIPDNKHLTFHVSIHVTTNQFVITESAIAVATGIIRITENPDGEAIKVTPHKNADSTDLMTPKDFYKELRLRGYDYKNAFKQVLRVNCAGTYGEIFWNDNFVAFMDNMAQISLLQIDSRKLIVPTFISKILIDFKKHSEILKSSPEQNPRALPVHYYPQHKLLNSGGIQISGCKCTEIARRKTDAEPVLEKCQFVPYFSNEKMDLSVAVRVCTQIVLENTLSTQVKSYEIFENDDKSDISIISPEIVDALNDFPLIQPNINVLKNPQCTNKLEQIDGVTISENKLPDDKSALIIILSNLQDNFNIIEEVSNALKDDGFIISKQSRTQDDEFFQRLEFHVCFSRPINAKEKILLLSRKTKSNAKSCKFLRITSDSFSWIPKLQTELSTIDVDREKLIIYSEKDVESGILGFFNCLRMEEKGLAARCFCIMDDEKSLNWESPLVTSQLDKNLSHNFYMNGQWGSIRRLRLDLIKSIKTSHALCVIEERGNLSSFKWIEGAFSKSRDENRMEKSLAHVYYSSLNFRDVLLSIGKISEADSTGYNRLMECYLGIEFSGRDQNGTRVMGIVDYRGISTMVETIPSSTWRVPDYMTLEEAATIPIVYSTVIHALFFEMKLRKGCSVLIHAGSGGVGQAAINICLHYGCDIFTTVGTPEKVEFIKKTFPQIPESHIGNSRNTSFLQLIMDQTNGKGVDVVLNSLSEEKLQASIRCLAEGGHFLEIGKFDMARNNSLELGHFLNRISFHSIQLDRMIKSQEIAHLREKLQEMLDLGIIKPIQRMIFRSDQVESAIRFMAAGKHTGKILIKIRDEDKLLHGKPPLLYMEAKPRVLCDENKSYVIIGGLGGFGMELVDWLILRGARKVVLSSRTGVKNGYQSYRMKLWRSYGVQIAISTEDVTKEIGVHRLLKMADSLAPVAGIFNLAVILKDGPFSIQTQEAFDLVSGPKSIATKHLDKLSRMMCPYLEHFVVFTSVSNGLGNQSQTNYAFANSVMERICENRYLNNLPALAIQWGAVGDVGIVADLAESNVSVVIRGTLKQKIKSCLDTLDIFMKQSFPVVGSMILAEKRHVGSDAISAIANILGIKDLKTINLTWTLPELGMDSIIATEIKQILDIEFNTFFTPEELRTMNFSKLYALQKENVDKSKSDNAQEVNTSLLQFFKNNNFINKRFLRLPFNDNEMDEPLLLDNRPTAFVFPGIEGFAITMEQMAKNLSLQMLCFQYYNQEQSNYSFHVLADNFAKIISDHLKPDQEFYLIGYSFGGLLALQVADILEKQGRKGFLYLIETSPSFFKAMAAEQRRKRDLTNEQAFLNDACYHLTQALSLELSKEDIRMIEQAKDWQSKKNHCCSLLSRISVNEAIMNRAFDQILMTTKELLDYETPRILLRSSCVLIRCTKPMFELGELYGLSEYFENPVEVHQIDANHFSIISHQKTAEIIMQSRSWEIQQNT